MDTPEILTALEECRRKAHWLRDWESNKLTPNQMLKTGVIAGLTETTRKDWGQLAGETLYSLGANHGLVSKQYDIHAEIVHLSAIAEAVTTAMRKGSPWKPTDAVEIGNGHTWVSDALLDPSGARLRRILFVSSWSDERHYSLCRSWESLGSVCVHNLPMQMAVVLLGVHRDGRYHGAWSKGYMHPVSKQVRFRRKHDASKGFKDTWSQVWREDFDHISTESWLQSMLDDSVLQDSLLVIDLPVPEPAARQSILDLMDRRLDELWNTRKTPDPNLSNCFWPQRCPLIGPCHAGEKEPSGRYGFFPISALM